MASAMTKMFKIALPDGSVKEMPEGSTPADVAAAIGPGLAKAALAAKVDGEVRDIMRPFEGDASLALITSRDEAFRKEFLANRPDMVALDLGMPGMDGVELLRFLAEQDYQSPVLIVSGFDRRVLESAFRLGEALGLNMAGPVEKPVRLEDLEAVLNHLRATLVI